MGKLIWHEYARYVSITASIYAVWAGFFGLFYRKFFWDFVGGILRSPGGLQPSPSSAVFITLIVKFPVIQSLAIILGLLMVALEYPLPLLKTWAIYRNFIVRIVLLTFQTFFGILYYQGTNSAVWSLIAITCYGQAVVLGEKMVEARENREKGGGV